MCKWCPCNGFSPCYGAIEIVVFIIYYRYYYVKRTTGYYVLTASNQQISMVNRIESNLTLPNRNSELHEEQLKRIAPIGMFNSSSSDDEPWFV